MKDKRPDHPLLGFQVQHGSAALQVLAARTDYRGREDDLLLVDSVRFCCLGEMECLLSLGADVRAVDEFGDQVLHWAWDVAVMARLVAAGADVNAINDHHMTPLMCVTKMHPHNVAMAAVLLDAGADIDVVDVQGSTALHHCTMLGDHAAMAELLLTRGADPEVRNCIGKTAAEYAEAMGRRRILAVFDRRRGPRAPP